MGRRERKRNESGGEGERVGERRSDREVREREGK